jgi:hypothetical protein
LWFFLNDFSSEVSNEIEKSLLYADDSAAYQARTEYEGVKDRFTGAGKMPSEEGGLHPCLHDYTQKAKLRASQGRSCQAVKQDRGDSLYPR